MIRTLSRPESEGLQSRDPSAASKHGGFGLRRRMWFVLLAAWVIGASLGSASASGLDGRKKRTDLWTFLTTLDETRHLLETDQVRKARNKLDPLKGQWDRVYYDFIFRYTTGRAAYGNERWMKAMGELRAASRSELVRHAPETLFYLGMAFRQLEVAAATEAESTKAREWAMTYLRRFLDQPSSSEELSEQATKMLTELSARPPESQIVEVPGGVVADQPPESQIVEASGTSTDEGASGDDITWEEPEPEGVPAPTGVHNQATQEDPGTQLSSRSDVQGPTERSAPSTLNKPGTPKPPVETRGSTIVWADPAAGRAAPRSETLSRGISDQDAVAAVDLSRFAGEVLVLHFWATWCAPCQTELPSFVSFVWEAEASLRQEGVEVSLVTLDKFLSSGEGFLESRGFGGLTLHHDPGYDLLRALTGTVQVPQTIVIHKDADQPVDIIPTSDWRSREIRDRLWRALDRAHHP